MKRNILLTALVAVLCMLGMQSADAKKVLVCTNGASTYHTWSKCKELKSCGLSAKVNEKDAQREGKSYCSVCKQHEADVAAEKAQKKADQKRKKAENKAKKQEKAAKKAADAQKKEQKAAEKALKEAQKTGAVPVQ